ncbi:MAG: YraN family protein [Alphaproteobacteria bacterium]|nr:YraN family protein [Alphaproteobacteria bacterium]
MPPRSRSNKPALRALERFAPNKLKNWPAAARRALRGKDQNNSRRRAHDFGLEAERIAAWFLRLKGYRIVAERYRNHYGEIDLLAVRGNHLVAVEVKARKSFAACEISVPPHKQQKILRAMEGLIGSSGKIAGLAGASHRNIRFDVIWVVRGMWPRHLKDAWRP